MIDLMKCVTAIETVRGLKGDYGNTLTQEPCVE